MKQRVLTAGFFVAAGIAALIAGRSLFTKAATAPAAEKQASGIPTFELDRSWPKVPDKWKLGDASSVAVDEQDHVWVLHRPRTLPADQISKAAPPVLEFDADGNFIQAGSSGYLVVPRNPLVQKHIAAAVVGHGFAVPLSFHGSQLLGTKSAKVKGPSGLA